MLDEEEPLRQALHDREEIFKPVHNEAAGHATQHLLGDDAMRVRVIPEQAWPLATCGRNAHLVVELMTRMHVDEHIVAVALRRHRHAVEM